MSYFNPKVYNKQNLKEKDRAELEYWESQFCNTLENAQDNFSVRCNTGSETMNAIQREIVEEFCKELKVFWGYALQNNVVGIIDHYEQEPDEVEDYETFLYKESDNDIE